MSVSGPEAHFEMLAYSKVVRNEEENLTFLKFTSISFNMHFFKLSHHKPELNVHEGSHPIHNIPTYIFDTFPSLDVGISYLIVS